MTTRMKSGRALAGMLILPSLVFFSAHALAADYYIDPVSGDDGASGTAGAPWRTVSKAVAQLPEVVVTQVNVHLAPGTYNTTGGHGIPADTLVLDRRMRGDGQLLPDVSVRFLGEGTNFQGRAEPGQVVFDWGGSPLVVAQGGVWRFENVQIGNRSRPGGEEGIVAYGDDSLVDLRDVRIRTGNATGSGIHASRGAEVHLYGVIELNEDLHELELPNSFCGISAEYNGRVRCLDSSGTLSMGNGRLSVGYFGVIELGCRTAHITSWHSQANCFALNNSGRIDVHGTTTTLCTKRATNTHIGPEDDGHVGADGSRIVLKSGDGNRGKVVLQKSSTVFGGPIVFEGSCLARFSAMSGSTLVGSATGAIESVTADTGSYCFLKCSGEPGSVSTTRNGRVWIAVAPALASGPSRLTSCSMNESNAVTIGWTDALLWYTVQYTTNLVEGRWRLTQGLWPVLDNMWSGAVPPESPVTFYRVQGQ